jgi:hypothetical protein
MAAPRLPEYDFPAVSRPAASPVDVFVRPRIVGEQNGLTDLARSLGSLAPSLQNLASDGARLKREKDTDEAGRAAEISQARSWAEAVERGEVQAGASPVFQRAWREVRGAARAAEYGTHLTTAWNSADNPLRNDDDPQAATKWVAEQRRAFLQDMDEDMQRGFLARAGEHDQRLALTAAAQRVQRNEAAAVTDLGNLMSATITNALRTGMTAEQAIAAAQRESAGLRFAGMDGARVNAALASAVEEVATRDGRTDILDAASRPRPDVTRPGQTVAGLGGPEWRTRAVNIREAVQARQYRDESRRFEMAERFGRQQAQAAAAEFNQRVFAAIQAGQPIPLPDVDTIRRVGRFDPNFGTTQMQLRASLEEMAQRREDRANTQTLADIGALRSELMAAPDPRAALNAMLIDRRLTDNRYLQDFSLVAERASEGRNFILSMDGVSALRQGITRGTAPEFAFQRPTFARASGIADQFFIVEMTRWATDFQAANQGRMPTPAEATAKAAELRQQADVFLQRQGDSEAVFRQDFWAPGQPLPLGATPAGQPQAPAAPESRGSPTSPTRPAPREPSTPAPQVAPVAAGPGAPASDPMADYIALHAGKPFTPSVTRRPGAAELEALQRALVSPDAARVRRALDLFDGVFGTGAAAFYLQGNR